MTSAGARVTKSKILPETAVLMRSCVLIMRNSFKLIIIINIMSAFINLVVGYTKSTEHSLLWWSQPTEIRPLGHCGFNKSLEKGIGVTHARLHLYLIQNTIFVCISSGTYNKCKYAKGTNMIQQGHTVMDAFQFVFY